MGVSMMINRSVTLSLVLFVLVVDGAIQIKGYNINKTLNHSPPRVEAEVSDSKRWNAVKLGDYKNFFVPIDFRLSSDFQKLPFASLEGAEVWVDAKYQSKILIDGKRISFPFPGVPIDLKRWNGNFEFAFRRMFDGDLYRLTYSSSGQMIGRRVIKMNGLENPIFRASTSSLDGLHWVIYNNKTRRNYLVNIGEFAEDEVRGIELPSFHPPAGGTYEMEPPIFFKQTEDNKFLLIAGAAYIKVENGLVYSSRLTKCEVAVEVSFLPAGPVALCRSITDSNIPYFLIFPEDSRVEDLSIKSGIPWKLHYQAEQGRVGVEYADSNRKLLELFLWDLHRSQQNGLLEFGINNIEGRIPWSQIYYLNGLMDALFLMHFHQDGHDIFSEIAEDIVQRIVLEVMSLDDLLDREHGFHTKGFTHDRSLALFAVQTSRLLLLFDRYTKEYPRAPKLKNAEKLYQMVARFDNHIETLAREGESLHWMKPDVAHLRWPKCSAFYFDGMAVPFNHQNEWAYSLFNAAEFRGVPVGSSALNDQRDIIRFF
jgi:hypothetical protein